MYIIHKFIILNIVEVNIFWLFLALESANDTKNLKKYEDLLKKTIEGKVDILPIVCKKEEKVIYMYAIDSVLQ